MRSAGLGDGGDEGGSGCDIGWFVHSTTRSHGMWRATAARLAGPGQDAIDQPLGQVVARIERFGIVARADQVDCVPSLPQGLAGRWRR